MAEEIVFVNNEFEPVDVKEEYVGEADPLMITEGKFCNMNQGF